MQKALVLMMVGFLAACGAAPSAKLSAASTSDDWKAGLKDGGSLACTVTNSDSYNANPQVGSGDQEAIAMVEDSQNNLYVLGIGHSTSELWTVRKSTDNGATWQTVDAAASVGGFTSFIPSRILLSGNRLYTIGNGYDSSGNGALLARTSVNNGSSWTTLPQVSGNPTIKTCTVDASQNLTCVIATPPSATARQETVQYNPTTNAWAVQADLAIANSQDYFTVTTSAPDGRIFRSVPLNGIYVDGVTQGPASYKVTESTDGGATFQDIDQETQAMDLPQVVFSGSDVFLFVSLGIYCAGTSGFCEQGFAVKKLVSDEFSTVFAENVTYPNGQMAGAEELFVPMGLHSIDGKLYLIGRGSSSRHLQALSSSDDGSSWGLVSLSLSGGDYVVPVGRSPDLLALHTAGEFLFLGQRNSAVEMWTTDQFNCQ